MAGREPLPRPRRSWGQVPTERWGVPSHFCSRECGDQSASRPTPSPSELWPLKSNLLTGFLWERVTAESPDGSADARARGRNRLHRTRVIAERYIQPPSASRGPRPTECRRPPRFNFQNNHGGGSINPIFQREKQSRGETIPVGKWLWQAWNSDTPGLGPFWHRQPQSRMGMGARSSRAAGWG